MYYEAGQERPVDDYHANMRAIADIRRKRDWEARPQLSFAELVTELDVLQGGEGLSCLVPRRIDPPPGEWQKSSRATWGELLTQK